MSVLRLVLAWLVMAALPLQGIAAASMLFCEQAAHSALQQPAGHDHATHGYDSGHDHGGQPHHGGDGVGEAQRAGAPQADAGSVDGGHACPICASCCNLVALSELPSLSLGGDSSALQPLQGPSRVLTRVAPTPDKPPRA